MNKRVLLVLAIYLATAVALPAQAESPGLVLDGDIKGGAPVSLSDADLLDFPQTQFTTSTQWTLGTFQFSGPSLAQVLEYHGAGSGNLLLTALNKYSVVVDRALITSEVPIIANRIDDAPIRRRDNGPLWVIFPYDVSKEYQTETVFSASVWQLTNITVLTD
jgi:hypothetical protein